MISQLTVFLENKEGRLASAVRSIARADINMQEEGYQARLIDVVAVKVPNVPGSLSKLFDYLDDKDINVEYAHCFMVGDHAIDILKVADPALDVKLAAEGFEVCKPEDVYALD